MSRSEQLGPPLGLACSAVLDALVVWEKVMGLNCKQGDLAVVVRSYAGNEGKIVRCMSLTEYAGALGFGPRWFTEPTLFGVWGEPQAPLDACLRPLRDTEGEDEMLCIAGRPQERERV